jgi:MFS family permease
MDVDSVPDDPTETIGTASVPEAPGSPLRIPHFRNLWLGSVVSLLGDQFYIVALPWLVLQLTGSSLALGLIMMTAAVPRAVLMLMGGAVSDRFAPRNILLVTTFARTLLVTGIALLTWTDWIQVRHLYVLAFTFGIADAFGLPAGQALLPTLVAREQLPAANALFSGGMQASNLLGPAPAGLVIKTWGMAAAFSLDAASFLFAIVPLALLPKSAPVRHSPANQPRMLRSIAEGLRYVWHDGALRSLVLLVAGINLWAMGPVLVGLPVLAKVRFGSSAAFGTMMSCFSGGALAGMTLAGGLRTQRRRGLQFLTFVTAEAVGLAAIAFISQFAVLAGVLVMIGIAAGLANVSIMAWIQGYVDRALMGRVMSVLMFAAFGLMPVSLVLAGAVADLFLQAMFVGAAALMVLTTMIAGLSPSTRAID